MSLSNYPTNLTGPSPSFVIGAPSRDRAPAESDPFTPNHSDPSGGSDGFVDRRSLSSRMTPQGERRQFGSSHVGLTDDGRELAFAIDQYKIDHHRRYLTCDEMLTVMNSLGYAKTIKHNFT